MKYHFRVIKDVDYPTDKDIFADSYADKFEGYNCPTEARRSASDCMMYHGLSKDEYNIELIIKK